MKLHHYVLIGLIAFTLGWLVSDIGRTLRKYENSIALLEQRLTAVEHITFGIDPDV